MKKYFLIIILSSFALCITANTFAQAPAESFWKSGKTDTPSAASDSTQSAPQNKEEKIRAEIQRYKQNISALSDLIQQMKDRAAEKGVSRKEKETILNSRTRLIGTVERQMEAFLKNIENYKATASPAFMQFLKEEEEKMIDKRNENLALFSAAAKDQKTLEKEREKAEKEAQEQKEAEALSENKDKILADIEKLKLEISILEGEEYSREEKDETLDELNDEIEAIEEFAKDRKLNKDKQVRDGLRELDKLFKQAKK